MKYYKLVDHKIDSSIICFIDKNEIYRMHLDKNGYSAHFDKTYGWSSNIIEYIAAMQNMGFELVQVEVEI